MAPQGSQGATTPGFLQVPLQSTSSPSLWQHIPAKGTSETQGVHFHPGFKENIPWMSLNLPQQQQHCSLPAHREDLSGVTFPGKSLPAFPSKLKIQAAISSSFLPPLAERHHETPNLPTPSPPQGGILQRRTEWGHTE